jgi:signal transduction histidine kinase/ActR/RegA family two-component response regulator
MPSTSLIPTQALDEVLSTIPMAVAFLDHDGKLKSQNDEFIRHGVEFDELFRRIPLDKHESEHIVKSSNGKTLHARIHRTSGGFCILLEHPIEDEPSKEQLLSMMLKAMREGDNLYEAAVIALATTLKWRWIFITRFTSATSTEVVCWWDTDHLSSSFQHDLADTPCLEMIQKGKFCAFQDVATLFPNDPILSAVGAYQYAGMIYRGANGQPVGHFFMFDDHARNEVVAEEILDLMAILVGSELRFRHSEMEIAKAVEQQNKLTLFLAVASHDLRQPMHAMNLYLGALRDVELPDTARHMLNNVSACAQTMNEMFTALLDLSRLDAQVVTPVIENFPIATVLDRLLVEFRIEAHSKDIEFHIEPSAAWVETDIRLVEQILRNLIANAVRYTNNGWVKVGCAVRDDILQVSVQDTGIGIQPRDQAFVFDEFRQVGQTARDSSKGLGLGLAIVKRLCRLLGVPIKLVSAVESGSMFSIDLPLAKSAPTAPALGTVDLRYDDSLRNKLIIIVDDDEKILDAMCVLFNQWGCTCITGKSSSEIVSQLGMIERLPDALLCDYWVGGGETGLDVVKRLQAEFNHEIPTLILTAETNSARIQEIMTDGIQILRKPFLMDALWDALVDLLRVVPR